MDVTELRIALFSGNYNYVRDGANRALNRLVGRLLERGAAVRVYAPTSATPAFEPTGDLVSLPSVPVPGRGEYRIALGLGKARADLAAFQPNIVHISSPDAGARAAVRWARAHGLPVLASIHTRFETYLDYYRLGFLEPVARAMLRNLYRRCDAIVAPSESFADVLAAQEMNGDIGIWSRGIEHDLFNPGRRSPEWRRSLGLGDEEMAVTFFGRLVLEKGLDMFAEAVRELARRGVPHRVLVIGEGPAREAFQAMVPEALFTGFLAGEALATAVASGDVLLNPSVTETFGNVTSEAMACGLPVVAARAAGNSSLVEDGRTGFLVPPYQPQAYAERLARYARDPGLRGAHGRAAHERAQRYEWNAVNDAVIATYLRLIAAHRYPAPSGGPAVGRI